MKKIYYLIFAISLLIIIFIFINRYNKYENFSKIPILNEGRVKPLESFAKSNFSNILVKKKSYSYYLAQIIFSFEKFSEENLFYIKNSDTLLNMNIKKKRDNLYSFNEIINSIFKNMDLIQNLLKKNQSELNKSQKEIIKIYNSINFILKIREDNNFSKKNNNTSYFYLIKTKNEWKNINEFFFNEKNENIINLLLEMAKYFNNTDKKNWEYSCNLLINQNKSNLTKLEIFKLEIENKYNFCNFLFYSVIMYLISSLFVIIKKNIFFILSKLTFILGFFLSSTDMFLRFLISNRPPVTNLYESIIFVNNICSILCLIIMWKSKNKINFFILFISISLLQVIGYNYNYDYDIKNLISVLNTNFWLTIHVLTITIGYSLSIISSCLAHIQLVYQIKQIKNETLFNYIYLLLFMSLIFTFLGTMLGGIWADQSWGRFWGWDPKENGALLIVLWITLILHAKLIFNNKTLFIIGAIILNVIVSISWFGVNLLNAGLHSYGFTENIGIWLITFIIFEFFYIFFSIFFFKKK